MVGSAAPQTVTMVMKSSAFLLFITLLIGCRTTAPVATVEEDVPPDAPKMLSGVDSAVTAAAFTLAQESFARDTRQAEKLAADGRRYARLADSLLGLDSWAHWRVNVDSVDAEARLDATEHFNDGALALDEWADGSVNSTRARTLLKQAAGAFEAALEADPFDAEVRYWLGHVYELQARHYDEEGSVEAAIDVLQKLVSLHQDRHDYIALMARMYDHSDTERSALASATLWERAALAAQDDATMGFDDQAVADSIAVFGYLIRSSRAFGRADRSDQALRVVEDAVKWALSAADYELVEAERNWLLWDDGNLQTRRTYDRILETAVADPNHAADELEKLLAQVRTQTAVIDVRHQLSLARYAAGQEAGALNLMQDLWRSTAGVEQAQAERIRLDYAVMAYNLAQDHRRQGDLTGALAYLLQCEQLDADISARAALQAAQLLSNNPTAALERALAAEQRWTDLGQDDQQRLLRYIVELYRRVGEREMARKYFDRLEEM